MTHLAIRYDKDAPNKWAVLLDDTEALRYLATREEAIDWALAYMQREIIKGGIQAIDKEQ